MLTSSTNLLLPASFAGPGELPSEDDCPGEFAPSAATDEEPGAFTRPGVQLAGFAPEHPSQPAQWRHRAKNTVAPRATGALNAFMASCLLCAAPLLAGCGGKVPGDERSMWLPATTIEPQELLEGTAFAGTNQELGFGFLPGAYYAKPSDISTTASEEQAALIGMLFDGLAGRSMNFSHPDVRRTIANNVFLTMTDLNAWPNAYYAAGMGTAYGVQVLDANMTTISDCSKTPCRLQDVIVIKNRSLHPTSRDLNSLTPEERSELDKMAEWMSEELGHDFLETADAAYREGFFQKVTGLWEAGSSGIEDDAVFSDAWKKGGIAYAIGEEEIKNYSLRGSLQSAIAEIYPGASGAERYDMEVALISWLQLIGDCASSLIGSPGRSYLDLYKQNDAAAGKSIGTYEYYRNHFIEREGFVHVVTLSSMRQVYPSLLRTSLDGPFWKDFLDQRFNDGFSSDARIMNNPYLSNFDALRTLVSNVIPLTLAKETDQH